MPVHDIAAVFIELGATVVGLAILARIASRWGFSAIPLYAVAGRAVRNGGLLPLCVREAVELAMVAGQLLGGSGRAMVSSAAVALVAAAIVVSVAVRYGDTITPWVSHAAAEVVWLRTFAALLLVAGVAQQLRVSAAIGA